MKRWILFLAIFAVGLAILLWVDSGRRKPPRPPEPSPGPASQEALTEVPLGDKTGAGAVTGAFSDTKFEEGSDKPVYRITAANTEPLGDGVYRFEKLVGRFFVPG